MLHVQTTVSSGKYNIERITELADGYGLDAVFLTDNLTQYIQFGVPPLRHMLWIGKSLPSIMTRGAAGYLQMVEHENRRQTNILYVAGAELCPRTYWTGSLKDRNLVCHDHQRNLIALGISNAEILEKIPECIGYVWPGDAAWIVGTRLLAALLLISLLCIVLLAPMLSYRSRIAARDIRWSALATFTLPVILLMVAANWLADRTPEFQIYGADHSPRHEQRTIDFLNRHGIVNYWAHPEAADHHAFTFQRIPFEVETAPYPAMLLKTFEYTGFGGIYEGRNTLIDPNSFWDRALLEYLRGRRDRPSWCYGEMLYHYEGQAKTKKLNNVETVILADERTPGALLNALRKGQCYARRNDETLHLRLDDWRVETAMHDPAQHTVHFSLSASAPGQQVTVLIIRNGKVIHEADTATPVDLAIEDTAEGPCYYRAVVHGPHPLHLAANPVFVNTDTIQHQPAVQPAEPPGKPSHATGEKVTEARPDPNYADPANWVLRPESPAKNVDVFFMHPTTYMTTNDGMNASLNNTGVNARTQGITEWQTGVFEDNCNIYAPQYRQASIAVLGMPDNERNHYLQLAVQDMKTAWLYYLQHHNQGRPFILAGHSQGANLMVSFLHQYPELVDTNQLVAAYVIGWTVTDHDLSTFNIPLAVHPDQTGAIISWNTISQGANAPTLLPDARCVNPLSWNTNAMEQPARSNRCARIRLASGSITSIPYFTSARIGKDGGLIIPPPAIEAQLNMSMGQGVYHAYDYDFFYSNLVNNAAVRTRAYLEKHNP